MVLQKSRDLSVYRLFWLVLLHLLLIATNAQGPDENRLLLLYKETKGDDWFNNTGWQSSDTPVCDWFGIICANFNKITGIRLSSNNLIGKIPSDIYMITSLQQFDVQDNQIIDGGLSGVKDAESLKVLQFAQNGITSLSDLSEAPDSLTEIHFTQNRLSGGFPIELTKLTSLEKVFLSFNEITGPLPTQIGDLTNLQWLYLYDNKITGQLPTEIGLLQRCEIFTLAENPLSGTIPTEVENMLNLRTFSLHNNEENKGNITGNMPLFKDSPKLAEVYLDGNELTGTIPNRFLQHSDVTQELVTVGLSYNQIEGTLPTSLGRFLNLNINLVGNKISGIPDEFCDKKAWMTGLVEEYGCDAILCPKGFSNPTGRQQSEDLPCTQCPLGTDYLGSTSCAPDGSDRPLTELQTLALMFVALRGEDWALKDGWDVLEDALEDQTIDDLASNTDILYCDGSFYGVTCDANSEITEIDLTDNGLFGEVPYQVFELSKLQSLVLSRNLVDLDPAKVFPALGKSTTLSRLNLAGTKVNNLVGIGAATSLRNLILDGIDFLSAMPQELFELSNLQRLHCQYTSFEGTLPAAIGDMTSLTALNMFANEFTGNLPSELGKLTLLHTLDLSENKFDGELPTEINNLVRLEKLHIHQAEGNLRGPLPAFDSFPKLTELELDSNSFSGSIPSNFLQGVTNKRIKIKVGLSYNNLGGGVPKELKDFDEMEIRLEGNRFVDLPLELCDKDKWMDGEVGKVEPSCDAIMCPPNTYNLYGKASSKLNATCLPCDGEEYFGNTYCGSDINPNPEKTILDNLYKMTGGRYWKRSENWTTPGVGICHREGIDCVNIVEDDDSGVLDINLNDNGLQGLIPPEIYDLPNVRLLSFSNNEVDLSFYGIEKATNLRTLKVSNTKVRNLDRLGSAPDTLTEIHLANNQIEGKISNEIYSLRHVQSIFLENNLFTGQVTSGISGMSSLVGISLSDNRLTGHLPTNLGLLTGLQRLLMSGNLLSGALPTELGGLVSLRQLDLSRQEGLNKLSGPLLSFDGLTSITDIDLSHNSLQGSIPDNFLSSAIVEANVTINLGYNDLTGGVPASLDRFETLTLYFEANQISDLPGVFCDGDDGQWMNGNVGRLGGTCDAILCPPGTAAEFGRQVEDGVACEACPAGVDDAPYYGSVECKPEDSVMERQILEELYTQLNGTNWITQTNWMSEQSVCTWFGITCENDGVTKISLEGNNLESVGNDVSQLIFSLPNLQDLDLKGNFVPLDFKVIPVTNQLTSLKLSDTGLPSLEGIGRAGNLHRAHVTNNGIPGQLPDELFTLTNLRHLFLSYNSFNGTLSPEIEKLSNLLEFYMFNNLVTGKLPTAIGKLTKLKDFIMSQNYLTGTIPTEFNSLPALEQLSLYDQQGDEVLSGPLPTLEAAPFVWYFDVSNNDMTGVIPDKFLQNSVYTNESVTIYLNFNDLQGAIPASLDRFEILDLGIVGNKFTSIPETLCDNPKWMKNAVGAIQSCDAIACAKGSYRPTGKQEVPGASNTCMPCNEGPAVSFVGQTICGKVGPDEKEILQLVYQMTGGDNWSVNDNWNTAAPICSWAGVLCSAGEINDDTGVTGLDLDSNNLVGRLPTETFMLPSLQVLKVENNEALHIDLDGLASAENLEVLYVSNVLLPSIVGISGAKKLRELHVSNNRITGTLPDEVFDLKDLEGLFIAFNSFSGTLSSRIGELTNLIDFYAFDNDFSGEIPSQLGSLSSLDAIVLSENLLSGLIPLELSSMPNLRVLSLFRRDKSGPKLIGPLPQFDKLPLLEEIYLDHNDLTGPIPRNFVAASVDCTVISLGHNRLSGVVPAELDFLDSVSLQLEANEISAFPPAFCDNEAWMDGNIGQFSCDAFLCPPHTASPIGRKNGTFDCEPCQSNGTAIYFGSISCKETRTEKRILNRLYQACGGRDWYRRDNWATDDVDICDWFGITCDATGSVIAIRLAGNNLAGTPYPDLFDLPQLQMLDLSYNPIDMDFPTIGNAKNLFDLRLDGIGPLTSLAGLEKATGLMRLDLRYNAIEQTFPDEILQLTNLRTLNMDNNRFSGPLPDSFGVLNYLRTLRLGSNSFSGPLPAFDDMNGLTIIDISENKLQGPIPPEFLERINPSADIEINLAQNRLRGTVPEELDRFERLTLYLRENDIVGLPDSFCDNAEWNDGTVGKYGCDAILCPPGTFSVALGRQRNGNTACRRCADNSRYYGQIMCESSPAGRPALSGTILSLAAGILAAILFW